jgi:nucleotidyltransferase substrate binding protein (TIGR01987 family)
MTTKLKDSIDLLQLAYEAYKEDTDNKLHRAALAKTFEVSFEYLWKYFKQLGSREGFEIYSPRDAIKSALSMKLISDPPRWETYLSHRNLSVHDYIGLDSEETPVIVRDFLKDVNRIVFKEEKK